ncbi:hypothetical protein CB1_000312004 [Camelus ferus]|nr:hypothetical protein CB1_000312004 [Camelus ferus]
MVFGIFLCLDAFLYVFTLLPLRVFLALFRLFTLPCSGLRDRRLLQPAQVCDILKGVILVICYFMMHYVDYSMMYHLIRGQSVIKLYIIYNMLEFVEIKGSVFKKFEKNNLFQMSNSDHLWVLFPDVCMVIASEIAVDIVKHAFITKFNDITADVYSEYRASLAFDLVSSRQKNAYTDYSDSVARRMGFIPLPLAVLLIRVVTSSIKVQGILSYACVVLFYFGLISLKVLNSIVLLGKSCQYVKEAKMEEKLFNPPPAGAAGKPCSKSQSKCKPSQGASAHRSAFTFILAAQTAVGPLSPGRSRDAAWGKGGARLPGAGQKGRAPREQCRLPVASAVQRPHLPAAGSLLSSGLAMPDRTAAAQATLSTKSDARVAWLPFSPLPDSSSCTRSGLGWLSAPQTHLPALLLSVPLDFDLLVLPLHLSFPPEMLLPGLSCPVLPWFAPFFRC